MTTYTNLSARQKYSRPQGMLWADNAGRVDTENGNKIIPYGYEVNTNTFGLSETDTDKFNAFIILPDHNRGEIDVSVDRLGQRSRMINGRMRSFHIADKRTISVSWDMLPSRLFENSPQFDPTTGVRATNVGDEYVVDNSSGAVDILDWYENHTGPFYVYLAYDRFDNFSKDYDRLNEYNEVIQMYITDFSYNVVRRGGTNYDFWNISVTLEEV